MLTIVLRFASRWSHFLFREIARRLARLKLDVILNKTSQDKVVDKDELCADDVVEFCTPVAKVEVHSGRTRRSNEEASDHELLEGAICASCGNSNVVVPYIASCGDVYCYVCLYGIAKEAESSGASFSCVLCGLEITSSRRAR